MRLCIYMHVHVRVNMFECVRVCTIGYIYTKYHILYIY